MAFTSLSNLPICLPTSHLLNSSSLTDGPCLGKPENLHMTEEITTFFHRQCLHLVGDSQVKASEYFKGYEVQLKNVFNSEQKVDAYLVHAAALLGTDMNQLINQRSETRLHQACRYGYLEIVKVLVNLGVDIDALNHINHTPLSLATFYGHTEVVRFLVSKGAKINLANIIGRTPLLSAVLMEHKENVKILLEGGANPDLGFYFLNFTPLMLAASVCSVEIVADLLKAGSKPDLRDIAGFTALDTTNIMQDSFRPKCDETKRILRESCSSNKLDCSFKPTNFAYAFSAFALSALFLGTALTLYVLYKVLKKKKTDTDKIEIDEKPKLKAKLTAEEKPGLEQPQNLDFADAKRALKV